MRQNPGDGERMTEEEARTVLGRVSDSQESELAAGSLLEVSELASVAGVGEETIRRELEILRHERKIQELDARRREEEAKLAAMRAETTPVAKPEDEQLRRQDWQRRQEIMQAWSERNEPETVPEQSLRRSSRIPTALWILLVAAAIFVFLMMVMVPSTTVQSPQSPTPPSAQ